eukprot:gene10181-11017_t
MGMRWQAEEVLILTEVLKHTPAEAAGAGGLLGWGLLNINGIAPHKLTFAPDKRAVCPHQKAKG